jgi:hypothetical protein
MIIRSFNFMKNPNFIDLMIAKSFNLMFRSHEIQSPDCQSYTFILIFSIFFYQFVSELLLVACFHEMSGCTLQFTLEGT